MTPSPSEQARFLTSLLPPGLGWKDRLKVSYRPYSHPFNDVLRHVPEGARVFDIGCGNGMLLALIANFRAPSALAGIEISAPLVASAREILSRMDPVWTAELSVYDGVNLPALIGEYDFVTLIDVIHHVPPENQVDFLAAVHDVMAPGATLLFQDIDAGRPLLAACNRLHDTVFSEPGRELKAAFVHEVLARVGFEVSPIHSNRVLWYPHFDIVCRKPA